MTFGSIFGLILAIVLLIVFAILVKLVSKQEDTEVVAPLSILGIIMFLFIWGGIFTGVTETDAFSAKSISWAEHNISKLEQKIENSDKEYDVIRYQTKLQKWEKNKEYYFDQIKENNKKTKEQK